MSKAEKFMEWHKSRMGHNIGVMLGIEAVNELTEENAKLREVLYDVMECVNQDSWNTRCDDAKQLLTELKEQNNDNS